MRGVWRRRCTRGEARLALGRLCGRGQRQGFVRQRQRGGGGRRLRAGQRPVHAAEHHGYRQRLHVGRLSAQLLELFLRFPQTRLQKKAL